MVLHPEPLAAAIRPLRHEGVPVVLLDPAGEPRIGHEPLDDLTLRRPDLACDGQGDVRHLAHGLEEDVDPLVLTDESQREQPRRTGAGPTRDRLTARQMRR